METLPPVVRPTDVVGQVTAKAARETGLAAGTPVVCGSNDTTVEFFGVGGLAGAHDAGFGDGALVVEGLYSGVEIAAAGFERRDGGVFVLQGQQCDEVWVHAFLHRAIVRGRNS